MIESGWPSSKQRSWLLFIIETGMFTSVLAQVIWVLSFESRASWNDTGALLVLLVSHCTVPARLYVWFLKFRKLSHSEASQLSWSCKNSFLVWSVHHCKLQVKIVNIYSFILYSFSQHAVFFLTNAGQFFVSMKWRSFVVEFKYLFKQ